MADEIIVRYKAVPDGFTEVNQAVNAVTNETKELQNQIKATFAEKSIDEATRALYEQGDVMGALITKYGDATKANKALQNELKTMAALGQQNTKEYKELAKAAAEMEDALGDTRNEVKRLASDTRLLDNVAQAGSGMAAAFSVAAGLSAALGSENENLQKTLAKVEGAMATLQGVQELANIATENGGIATVAYGAALKGVEAISKTFGISMQASWALATGGLSLLVAGVVALIAYMGDAEKETVQLTEAQRENLIELEKLHLQYLLTSGAIDEYTFKTKNLRIETDKSLEDIRRTTQTKLKEVNDSWLYWLAENTGFSAIIYGERQQKLNKIVEDGRQQEEQINKEANARQAIIDAEEAKRAEKALREKLENERRLRAEYAIKEMEFEKQNQLFIENELGISAQKGLEKLKESFDANKIEEPLITDGTVDATAVNAERMADLMAINLQLSVKNYEDAQKQQALTLASFLQSAQQLSNGIAGIISQSAAISTQRVQEESSRQLEILNAQYEIDIAKAGNNAKKREQIDKRYAAEKKKMDKELAISQAKINRDQAIANKALALANVAINIAEAVSKYAGQGPAGYIQMALAIGLGAAQTAIIAATPIPEIPKFEKGGAVPLVGGRIDDGHLVGRSHSDGGILINAQGGEYIWDIPTVKKHGDIIRAAHENSLDDLIFHKYVAPMVSNLESLSAAAYDDALLRNEVRKTRENDNKNAKMIVSGIATAISDNIYFSQRYR